MAAPALPAAAAPPPLSEAAAALPRPARGARWAALAGALLVALLVNGATLLGLLLLNTDPPAKAPEEDRGPVALDALPPPPPPPPRMRGSDDEVAEHRAAALPSVPPLPGIVPARGLATPELGPLALAAGLPEFGAAEGNPAVVLEEDQVEEPPSVLRRVPPAYPAEAQDLEIEGWVRLRLLVDAEGRVQTVQVLGAEPVGFFEAAARAAVQSWTFRPAREGGRPVPVWCLQTLRFELEAAP